MTEAMCPTDRAVPEEVDVFSLPHLRMKGLVNDYIRLMKTTNFSQMGELNVLLQSLCKTFKEFKTHEQIENKLIMKRLRSKMKKLSVQNQAVCNCHKDDQLGDMLGFINDGYNKKTLQDRVNYGRQLHQALDNFTSDFLPHMKEEEEVFQPLLQKYFSYSELCQLKKKVIARHISECADSGLEKESSESSSSSDEEDSKSDSLHITALPPELLQVIFSFLSPRDLCRAASVSSRWSQLCLHPALWPSLLPRQWARGKWSFQEQCLDEPPAPPDRCCMLDDDADIDEAEPASTLTQKESRVLLSVCHHLVSKVGPGVHSLNLAHCSTLSSGMVQRLLRHCTNLRHLNLSYTRISDAAFKEVAQRHSLQALRSLDLTACLHILDTTLIRLTRAMIPPSSVARQPGSGCSSRCHSACTQDVHYSVEECGTVALPPTPTTHPLQWLSLSGCTHITDTGLSFLSGALYLPSLLHLDMSGCHAVSGGVLHALVAHSPHLPPPSLYYCDNIQDGPYPHQASGCQNLECDGARACCRYAN